MIFPYPARLVQNTSDLQAGDFYFMDAYGGEKNVAIGFMCPCGCGSEGCLDLRRTGFTDRPSWEWDGNLAHPTLTPSIQRNSACRWHGHLTAGMWTL